jgi:hypothetical protein
MRLFSKEEPAIVEAIPLPQGHMTRGEKRRHWARLIRTSPYPRLSLFHKMEDWNDEQMRVPRFGLGQPNAFSLALGDKTLVDAGYAGGSASDALRFFELSQTDLHAFSCDCGGAISNEEMASRIERLAS